MRNGTLGSSIGWGSPPGRTRQALLIARSSLANEVALRKGRAERSNPQAPYLDLSATLTEQELARIQWDLGQPSQIELNWLIRQGVTWDALVKTWPISACRVQFNGRTFYPDPNGVRAITIAVIDYGEIIDIAAWQPRSGRVASWLGHAFCIDQDQVSNPATFFADGALRVHRTPLEWLRAGRDGIVILRPELSYIYLGRCHRLWVADVQFAARLRRWLQPPTPTVEIIIADTERGAAA
jgi:hypothetical protein